MRPYEVYLHFDLLESVPKGGGNRRRILDFVNSLREHPDTPGDYEEKGASQRVRQVKVIGDYAVVYWLDAPVHIIMVVDVRLSRS